MFMESTNKVIVLLLSLFVITGCDCTDALLTNLPAILTAIGTLIAIVTKASYDMKKLNKDTKDSIKEQIEKANDEVVEVVVGEIKSVNESVTTLTSKVNKLDRKVAKIEDDVSLIQWNNQIKEERRSKRNEWLADLDRDWAACKMGIQIINDEELMCSAITLKDAFIEYAKTMFAIELSYNNASEKDILLKRIEEKFESFQDTVNTKLKQVAEDDKVVDLFKYKNYPNDVGYIDRITKSFKDNVINNIAKNIFNYTSQYLNESLNTLATSYAEFRGITMNDINRKREEYLNGSNKTNESIGDENTQAHKV